MLEESCAGMAKIMVYMGVVFSIITFIILCYWEKEEMEEEGKIVVKKTVF